MELRIASGHGDYHRPARVFSGAFLREIRGNPRPGKSQELQGSFSDHKM
jgi:hypothetical protein